MLLPCLVAPSATAAGGCALWQVLQHLPSLTATAQQGRWRNSSAAWHDDTHSSRGLSTSSAAAQQPDANPQQQQQQQQEATPSTSNRSSSSRFATPSIPPTSYEAPCAFAADSRTPHGLLAFDEVYVSSSTLRPSSTPSTAVLQQQDPITAIFLHGLLGSSKNWRSFTRKLAVEAAAKANRDVRVLLLDLRCHGETASRYGFHPPHDMGAAAADVAAIIQHELQGQAPHVLAGLSLGGKVALQVLKHLVAAQEEAQHSQQHLYQPAPPILPPADAAAAATASSSSSSQEGPQPALRGIPQQVWVLDSQPGTVPLDVDAPTSVGKIIQLLHSIPTPLSNRQELYRLLQDQGIPLAVAQWLGTSLAPGGRWAAAGSNGSGSNGGGSNADQKLDWVFDIQGAAALYNSYRLSSYWDVLTAPPPGTVVHLVRGELSDRWTLHMLQQLDQAYQAWEEAAAEEPERLGQLQMHCLERAGHWLQADNPEGLHALMLPWFRDTSPGHHLQW